MKAIVNGHQATFSAEESPQDGYALVEWLDRKREERYSSMEHDDESDNPDCGEDMCWAATVKVLDSMAKKKEEAISKALDIKLGGGCWSLRDLLRELRFSCDLLERDAGEWWEQYELDGQPLVAFGPPEAELKDTEISYSMKTIFYVYAEGEKS